MQALVVPGSGLVKQQAEQEGLDRVLLVAGFESNSPAARSGLVEGDIILALDGVSTPAVDSLHKLLTADRIGERAIVSFLRGVELRRHAIIPLEMPGRP